MSDSVKCPRCQVELPANFPPGVCPTCLMQQGLSNSTFIGEAGSASGNSRSGQRRSWTPPTPAELAPRFPQLEIVELLGQGGMGAVYKVRQRGLDRWAALKVLPDEVAHDPNFSERFQREARALALLGHQHIVIVYEFGQRDGVYFLLMEYIDGVTLRRAIRAGQISAKDALGIVTQICDALQFAHEEGVVHRDIKPENILIDKRGRVKIADFGLAKLLGAGSVEIPMLTGTHQVMGTPMYMAPEQMEGTRGVDHRADIFSLGVVFYELLTGELPLGRFPQTRRVPIDLPSGDAIVDETLPINPKNLQVLGWRQEKLTEADDLFRVARDKFPVRVSINRQGKWYRWSIEVYDGFEPTGLGGVQKFVLVDSGNDPELPTALRHFLRDDLKAATLPSPEGTVVDGQSNVGTIEVSGDGLVGFNGLHLKTLSEHLREMDNLRRGEQTLWEDVEQRTKLLLTAFTAPADKGRIHWQAAHVYGQSDIRGHAAEVTRHAKESIKYERDPVQRGWLYTYLGSAAEVRDDFPATFDGRRTEATRWYLKGYAELLPFKLPEVAPEVPRLGITYGEEPPKVDREIDPDRVALEVRRAAQLRTREEAEFTRELVRRRDAYIGHLRELFGRLHEIYDKNMDAKERLDVLAGEVLLGRNEIEKLMSLVLPGN